MTYDAARPTWPDHLSPDRLPDDVTVFVVGHRDGHRGRTHLFERCQTFDQEEANYRAIPLGHPAANRDDICSVCLGDHAQPKEGPSGPWETLEEANPETPVDELADHAHDHGDDQPDDETETELVTDGGLQPHLLDCGADPYAVTDGGQQQVADNVDPAGPTCDYGDCQEPAAEVYKVASPSGPLEMKACPAHRRDNAAPVREVDQ